MGNHPARPLLLYERFPKFTHVDGDEPVPFSVKGFGNFLDRRLIDTFHHFDGKPYKSSDVPPRVLRSAYRSDKSSSFDVVTVIPHSYIPLHDLPSADQRILTKSWEEQYCSFTKGTVVLFIITEHSVLFNRYRNKVLIRDYRHSFEQGGRTYLQFPAVVSNNPVGLDVDRGRKSASNPNST